MSFSHSKDKDMMIALRLFQMMLGAGASIEEAMKSVADSGLGSVSKSFSSIIKQSISSSDISSEIKKEISHVHFSPLKKLLLILDMGISSGGSCGDSLLNLANMLDEEEKIKRKSFLKKIALASDMLTYVSMFSVVVIIFYLMSDMMQYGPYSIIIISYEMVRSMLMFSVFAYILIILYIKIIEGVR
ncbi:MAG: type II secretion system F family protein [DPANN group archaeon]|nr:type II secretion system F family protein [DPANN group archaeon]